MQPTLFQAVTTLYPNAVTMWGVDVNSLVVHDSSGNPIVIDPNAVTNQLTILQDQYTQEQTAKDNAKASAIAKLTSLGLTVDEIKAIVGA